MTSRIHIIRINKLPGTYIMHVNIIYIVSFNVKLIGERIVIIS